VYIYRHTWAKGNREREMKPVTRKEIKSAKVRARKSTSAKIRAPKTRSANAKARNLRPKKERKRVPPGARKRKREDPKKARAYLWLWYIFLIINLSWKEAISNLNVVRWMIF
jgi:hypothetical protein